MKITDKQIEEIAEYLECGIRCYLNKKTGELKDIINVDCWDTVNEELWQDDIRELEENRDNYVEFEGMESRDSFRLMSDFADSISDLNLKGRLFQALSKSKPFRNFKWLIDNSGDYRQEWFEFKKNSYIQWVKEQVEFKM